MSDYYTGEIRMFGGSYAPKGWTICDGKTLPIQNNNELYALLGTTYGGDGINTFGIPDFRGRVPVGQGTGAGLTARTLGQTGGEMTVTVTPAQMPTHTHTIAVVDAPATTGVPENAYLAQPTQGYSAYVGVPLPATVTEQNLAATVVSSAGSTPSHNNVMPSQALTFIIATGGLYPTRP